MSERRLLVLNWRDPWHPRAGGAERMTHELVLRLVQRGWSVEWFSGAYPGRPATEVVDGIRFVRRGSQFTVHLAAFARYRGDDRFDVVIDEINTIPFFAPLYFRAPVLAYLNQLAREVWLYEGPAVAKHIGYALEPLYLKPYARLPVMTISRSSRETLRAVGLHGPIDIVPIGVEDPAVPAHRERSGRDVIVVGRVTRSKRIEESIRAAALLRRRDGWDGVLRVVGAGDERYLAELRALAQREGASVVFEGRVSEARRQTLLRAASLLWMTSAREGWGLVVTEAARVAVPSVVYDVPGLRDAVENGAGGRVVRCDPVALADASLEVWADYGAYAERALAGSLAYRWDASADVLERLLISIARPSRASV